MALLRYEPFSETTTALDIFDAVAGTITISSASARFADTNSQGASFPQNALGDFLLGSNPGPTIFLAFSVKLAAGAGSAGPRSFVHFKDGTTIQASLGVDTSNRLQFYRGAAISGTAIGSNSGATTAGSGWRRYECKIKLDASAGTVDLRMDGAGSSLITGSSLNSKVSANSFINAIRIGDCDGGLPSSTLITDVIIYTDSGAVPNDFLGDRKFLTSKVSGAGSSTQFTPSTGSNFQCVDDLPPNDDTDYVSDSTAGHKDYYTITALSFSGNADFVGQIYRSRKDDAGVRTLRGNIKSSSSEANGATNTLSSSYKFYGRDEAISTDPNGGGSLSQSVVNALQIGPELVS